MTCGRRHTEYFIHPVGFERNAIPPRKQLDGLTVLTSGSSALCPTATATATATRLRPHLRVTGPATASVM
jgi:hypothetical protein